MELVNCSATDIASYPDDLPVGLTPPLRLASDAAILEHVALLEHETFDLRRFQIGDLAIPPFTFRGFQDAEKHLLELGQIVSRISDAPATDWNFVLQLYSRVGDGVHHGNGFPLLVEPHDLSFGASGDARQGVPDHPCLQQLLTLSFGNQATNNYPRTRTLTFGDLVHQWSVPETMRGKLTAEQYHALDKSDPVQKACVYRLRKL